MSMLDGLTPRYEVIIYWSNDDQAFIAEVPELPGCAADGTTYQEALANVEVIVREWIETARELGQAIPIPKSRVGTVQGDYSEERHRLLGNQSVEQLTKLIRERRKRR